MMIVFIYGIKLVFLYTAKKTFFTHMKSNTLRNLHLTMEYDSTFKGCSAEKNQQKFIW